MVISVRAEKVPVDKIPIEGYIFKLFPNGKIIVASDGRKNKTELEFINHIHQKYREESQSRGRKLEGEFLWCGNPECKNACYARKGKIEEKKPAFCSMKCSAKINGSEKGRQIGGAEATEKRIANIREAKARKRKETTHANENPVPRAVSIKETVSERVIPEEVIKLRENKKVGLKCLSCKKPVDDIPGNPGTCPVCGSISVFITVAKEAPT